MDSVRIKNMTEKTADLYFYGEIVGGCGEKWSDEDACPSDVANLLKTVDGKDLNIYLNSPGGNVFAGIAIYNMLRRHKGKKTCYVDGLAASIASVILMAGDEIIMPQNSMIMIHKPSCLMCGNADDMRKMAADLDRAQEAIEGIYKTKLHENVTIEEIKNLMDAETWFTASEAQEIFNLSVIQANKAVAYAGKEFLSRYDNVPSCIKSCLYEKEENTEESGKDEEKRKGELLKMQLDLLTI